MVHTTINLGIESMEKLTSATMEWGISREVILSALLKHAGKKIKSRPDSRTQVQYQSRRPQEEWKRVHLLLRRDEYEYFVDLRKVLKLSVSFIIAESIDRYLDELLALIKEDPDNYQYRNYVIMFKTIDNVTCITIYWGIPPEIIRHS